MGRENRFENNVKRKHILTAQKQMEIHLLNSFCFAVWKWKEIEFRFEYVKYNKFHKMCLCPSQFLFYCSSASHTCTTYIGVEIGFIVFLMCARDFLFWPRLTKYTNVQTQFSTDKRWTSYATTRAREDLARGGKWHSIHQIWKRDEMIQGGQNRALEHSPPNRRHFNENIAPRMPFIMLESVGLEWNKYFISN